MEECGAYAEITAKGVFHPVSCSLLPGHDGPHAQALTVTDADEREWPSQVEWPPATS